MGTILPPLYRNDFFFYRRQFRNIRQDRSMDDIGQSDDRIRSHDVFKNDAFGLFLEKRSDRRRLSLYIFLLWLVWITQHFDFDDSSYTNWFSSTSVLGIFLFSCIFCTLCGSNFLFYTDLNELFFHGRAGFAASKKKAG